MVIIFEYGKSSDFGEIRISPPEKRKIKPVAVKFIGLMFLAVGLTGASISFWPIISTEAAYRYSKKAAIKVIKQDDKVQVTGFAKDNGITNTYFSIFIPKINAKAQILQNVDPVDSELYLNALRKGVAHAAGSVFPGMPGATYLFAHSTQNSWEVNSMNAIFYLVKDLEEKDRIYVFFNDKIHKYSVSEKSIVDANDIKWLNNAKEGKERLILQTCWPPGTTWKRLVIVALPVS